MDFEVVWNAAADRRAAVAHQRPAPVRSSHQRAVRAWMAAQASAFTSADLAVALQLSRAMAAAYCSQAYRAHVLLRSERTERIPTGGGQHSTQVVRRWYWRRRCA